MDTSATDFGILIVRVTLGGMLVIHALNKILGPGGLTGTANWFASIGLHPGRLHAYLATTTELGAGLLMCAGLLQPLTSAGFVGLMAVAAFTDHRGKGFFVFKGGWEYVAVVGLTATAVASTGPGRWSLDHVLGVAFHGIPWAIGSAVVGLTGACVVIVAARRPDRPAAEQPVT
ncbi:hypothetical protein GCM10010377_68110 [Streptomyces viridiviolaceus]|uniref:DoxX family protein n=1 Tax=Streptomyces viridiviolaceus TaxID=68282 RepID=A0ABW2ECH5_9ACTN|nr:DoxX family protein [Streptomyces viridiviolaceus]GHB67594.1 hypothetical protein GCM10010377_68110 [Streptomyces viridiviolaceus]